MSSAPSGCPSDSCHQGAPSGVGFLLASRGRLSQHVAPKLRMHEGGNVKASAADLTAYPDGMVNPALQSAIESLSLDERLELVEYIESTVESSPIEVTEEQKSMIRSRAEALQADPSIGLTRDELKTRLAARRA